jgi:hypothetical protein
MIINKKITYVEAILSLYPNNGTYENPHELNFYMPDHFDYSTLEWNCDLVKPTEEEVIAERDRLQAEYDSLLYQRQRYHEYPDIREQLDALWHDIDNNTLDNTGNFYNLIKEIKDNHPNQE